MMSPGSIRQQKRANGRLRIFSISNHALKLVHHRNRSTPSCATVAIGAFNSVGLKETRGDPGWIMADEAALVALMPIQLKEMKIVGGDRHRSRLGRLPSPFLGVVRLRSRPERQLLDSLEANRVLNRFQNRVLNVAQLRNQVIAILCHLPEFDPGDQRSPKEEGTVRRSYGSFWKRFDARSKKMRAAAVARSKKMRIAAVKERKQGVDPKPDPEAAFCTLGFGLVGSSFGKPGQTHKWADWAAFAIIHSFSFSFWRFGPPTYLDHYCNWSPISIPWIIGPFLQLIFHFNSLVNWVTVPNFHP